MPINKIVPSIQAALDGLHDGATVLVSGFGDAGSPGALLGAAAKLGLRDLTVVSNNAGAENNGLDVLIESGAVHKMVCSFPRASGRSAFARRFAAGAIELELVAQGTLSERIRAAGAGIGAFYTSTGAGTALTQRHERRVIAGEEYVLEFPLHADFALIRGWCADRWGNLTYHKAARNFGPTMAAAATTTVVEVPHVVPLGSLDPEHVITPGIYVDRVLEVPG
jgi:3-oxoadipate CoA-transferase alpha subunit